MTLVEQLRDAASRMGHYDAQGRWISADWLRLVADRMASLETALRAFAEMRMPQDGPGTAWPTEYCPMDCGWEGKADRIIPAAKQIHSPDCPITIARQLANSADTASAPLPGGKE